MSAPFRIDLRDVSTFPTRRDEAWRYSDFRRLVSGPVEVAPRIEIADQGGPFAGIASDALVFVNGRTLDGRGVAALVSDGGVQKLRFITCASNAGWQACAELRLKAGRQLTVLETYEGEGGAYVASASLRFVVDAGARLERIVILDEPAEAVSVAVSEVELSPGARFAQTVVATGARLQRHETHVHHRGGGAAVRLDSAYLLGGARHADITTLVEHSGTDGQTTQLTKGIVSGTARGVFQGKIVVSEGADKTDARMRHDALLLSDRAEIDAKPELEIYADEVACAHGNTIGALDENALFYIRSRGVPEREAQSLLTSAFLAEVAERIEHDQAREIVGAHIQSRLEALG